MVYLFVRTETAARTASKSEARTHMQDAMEEMGKKPTADEIEKFMSEVDLDGNGTVGMLFTLKNAYVAFWQSHTSRSVWPTARAAPWDKEKACMGPGESVHMISLRGPRRNRSHDFTMCTHVHSCARFLLGLLIFAHDFTTNCCT
jgi:hypothetical protein